MMAYHIAYFVSIVITAVVMAGIAVYSYRKRDSAAGTDVYLWIALLVSLLSVFQGLSMMGPTDEWALFWFNMRIPCFALIPVLWLVFVFRYVGRPTFVTRPRMAALIIIPLITQVMVWTNGWHGLWVARDVQFHRAGPFFVPDTSMRVIGPWFAVHNIYTYGMILAGLIILFITVVRMKRGQRQQALLLGAGTMVMLIGAIFPTFNLVPGMMLNPLPQSFALGSLIIAWALFRHKLLAETPQIDRSKPIPVAIIALFIALTAGIIGAGFVNYRQFVSQYREQTENKLSSIAELKVDEIWRWRMERLGDGATLCGNAVFNGLARRYLSNPGDDGARLLLGSWLEKYLHSYDYDSILLLDARGIAVLSVAGKRSMGITAHDPKFLEEARRAARPVMLDFHRETPDTPIHLSVIAPLVESLGESPVFGFVLMVINPDEYLYPMILRWPVESRTAETLLVRRDGDSVQFVNELRFRKNSALNLRFPLSNRLLPAAAVVRGVRGIFEGIDYKGVPVFAALRAIPDSPWFLVARMDKEEVYAPVRERFWYIVSIMLVLIAGAGAGSWIIWRRRDDQYMKERMRAAGALRESEEKFRNIFESSTIGKSITAPDGRLLQVNRAFADMLGYSIEEMQKIDFVRLTHPDDLAESRECVRLLLAGERDQYRMEKRYLHKDGSVVWTDVSTMLHRNAAGAPEYFITSINNITTRKLAEEKIREKDIEFRKLSDNLPDMVFQFTRKPDGSYYVPISSQGISNIFGCQPEDVADSFDPIVRVLHPEDAGRVISDIEHSAVYFTPFTCEFRVLVPGRPVQWILSRSTPEKLDDGSITWYGFCANITDRRQAEDAMRALTSRQEALLGAIPDIVMEVDANKVYTWANGPGRGFFGEHVIGHEAADFFVGEQETYEIVERLFNGDESIMYLESLQRRVDGEERLLAWWYRVLKDEKGNVTGALSTARDITERKRAEATLAESERKYRLLADNMVDFISVSDLDFKINYISPSIEKALGYTFEELQSLPLNSYMSERSIALMTRILSEEIENEKSGNTYPGRHRTYEVEYTRKDGSRMTCELKTSAIRDAGANAIGLLNVGRDITDRVQAEVALRESERKFRETVANLDEGYYSCLVDGTVLEHNRAFNRILGIDEDRDMKGARLPDFWLNPEERGVYLEHLETKGSIRNYTVVARKTNGDSIDVILNSHIVFDETGKPLRIEGTFIDITDRVRMEERFRIAAESMSDVIYEWDLKERIDWFGAIDGLMGYEGGGFPRTLSEWEKIVHPDDRERVLAAIDRHIRGEAGFDIEYRIRKKDESFAVWNARGEIVRNVAGVPLRMYGAISDITARKQAEDGLRALNERLSFLVDANIIGVVRAGVDGAILEANDYYLDFLGYTREEFEKGLISWKDRTPLEHLAADERAIKELQERGVCAPYEKEYFRKDGTRVWVYLVDAMQADGSIAAYALDITERKRAEENIRRVNESLEQRVRERTASLEESNRELESFSYSVSHDLRAPLRSIDGFSQVILEDYAERLDDAGRGYLDRIRAATDRMARLIDDILKLSRLGRTEMRFEGVDLGALARTVADELRKQDPGRSVDFIIGGNMITRGDSSLLKVALDNLLGNAWKFTSRTPHARIEFGATDRDGVREYFVRDNGVGFDMKYASKLFGAFQRLHSTDEFEGTGIGLALVRRIVSRHGGTVRAEGEVGKGACFYFTIPELRGDASH